MANEYKTIITDAGAAKIAAAIASGVPVLVKQAAIGDGAGADYTPTPAQTDLRREVWHGPIVYSEIDPAEPKMMNIRFIVPPDVGGFVVREAGLFDADGVLLAVCNLPATKKEIYISGTTGKLTIIMHIVVTDAGAVKIEIRPDLDTVTREEMLSAFAALKRFSLDNSGLLSNSVVYGYFDGGATTQLFMGQINVQVEGDLVLFSPHSFAPDKPPQDAATLVFFGDYAADGGDTIKLL